MARKIIDDTLKSQVIDYYKSKPMSLAQVAKEFNLSSPTVGKILKDIPKYTKAQLNNPGLIENFFETIDSEEKAYFLGLLISDGNVFKDDTGRQSSISITLDLKDEYLLLKFKEVLCANTSVGHDGRGCGQMAVRSNKMAVDLQQYGIVPRKSYDTYLPLIDDSLMNHLIRGIFDGDGSILAKLNTDNRYLHGISFCGTHELMQNISDYCSEHLHLKQVPTVYDYKDRKLSEIKIQNIEDIHVFGEWMYTDATIKMERKFSKYLDFKEHYNLK